jgi:isopenicillin-N N-acyltransferase-like protein
VGNGFFPQVTVRGGPFERGRQHGAQAGDLIAAHLAYLIDALCSGQRSRPAAPTRGRLLERALAFLPLYEAYAPDLVEEIRGVAAGARISFAEALLLNVRGEALGVVDEGCTAFAVGRGLTAGGAVLAGQTSDQAAWNREVMIVLAVEPDTGPAALMCAHAGLIGYHGCNAAGVGQFANAVPSTGWRMGLPQYLMKRRLLAQPDVAGCLAVLRETTIASAGNYVLADRTGSLLDVEITSIGLATLEPADDLIVHTNHYQHPDLAPSNAGTPHLAGSMCRATRLTEIIRAAGGAVTVETMMAALGDHASEPEQICSRGGPHGMTVAAMIAELAHGRLHVARGGPAPLEFQTYIVP